LWSGIAAGDGGFHDGPYTIQIPEKFFYDGYYSYAFNPEVGNVGVPKADTIRATMPPEAWGPPQSLYGEHPNATWFYHKFIQYADGQNLIPGQIEDYGKYTTLDDFCEKVMFANQWGNPLAKSLKSNDILFIVYLIMILFASSKQA
jgi:mannosylglycoprotein endo-beta-mannosidase